MMENKDVQKWYKILWGNIRKIDRGNNEHFNKKSLKNVDGKVVIFFGHTFNGLLGNPIWNHKFLKNTMKFKNDKKCPKK